jgi:signal transduction histidine kinase
MSLKIGNSFFHTLAFRLTLLYFILFTVTAVAIFIFAYRRMDADLLRHTDSQLRVEVLEYTSIYRSGGVDRVQGEFDIESIAEGSTEFYRFFSRDREVLASSDTSVWDEGLFEEGRVEKLEVEDELLVTLDDLKNKRRVRVIYKKFDDGTILEVGKTLEENERTLLNMRGVFSGSVLVALIASSVLVWLIMGMGMRGVERVTSTAANISRGNLASRVPVGKEGREIESLAKTFNTMLDRIQTLIVELREVTDNIAHDLRTPLTRIRGAAETLLTKSPDTEESGEKAVIILGECDRLINMINIMLEITRAETGIESFKKEMVDMVEVVETAHELFMPLAEERGVAFRLSVPKGPLFVPGYPAHLQRLIANLLENAFKYSVNGGSVSIDLVSDGDDALLSIADSGLGISEDDLPNIFDKFYRGDQSRSEPGNGLGLSLVRAYVREHDGEIFVRSAEGKGSTFTVHLPLPAPGS